VPHLSPAQVVAIAQLPPHPVFLTDLDAGVIALAIRFDVRDAHTRHDGSDRGFPGLDNAEQIKNVLATIAKRLGPLVDVSPLVAVLDRAADGIRHPERDLHDQLDTLAALGCDPGHVIIRETEEDDLAIARFLAAAHLALFGTLPVQVNDRIVGCTECALYRTVDGRPYTGGGRPFTGQVIGTANSRGELAPGYRISTRSERDARSMEEPSPFSGLQATATLRLLLRAYAVAGELTSYEIEHAARFHSEIVLNARALGLIRPIECALVVG